MKSLIPSILASIFSIALTTADVHADNLNNIQMPVRGICAHRGASISHPENTIAAFKEAIRLGAHMIELDLALTRDNQIVVLHDSTLDRTTDGSGPVEEWSLADLKKLDAGIFKGQQFKGERIPTFEEALALMPENIWINVHLKGGGELAVAATKVIVQQERLHQSFLACGSVAADAAKDMDKRIQICNMEKQANNLTYVNESIEANSAFLQLFGGNTVDPAHTKLARENGLRINFCCTNDADVLKQLFSNGVEFPLVDDLETMMTVATELGIKPLRPIYRARNKSTGIATPNSHLENRIKLNKAIVSQGIAASDAHFFGSNADSLVRFDKQWNFIEEKKLRLPGVNHFGAIDYHEGFLWAGLLNGPENGEYDASNDKGVIAKIDASTLEVVATWDISERLTWIDPVTFDGKHLWVGDLRDLGIHRYEMREGKAIHTGTLRYPRELHFSQGLRIQGKHLYSIHTFGTADGLFQFPIPDTLTETPVNPKKVWRIPELFSHAEGFMFVPGKVDEIWHAQVRHVDRIRLEE